LADTPSSNKSARDHHIGRVDRHYVVDDAAHAARGHRTSISAPRSGRATPLGSRRHSASMFGIDNTGSVLVRITPFIQVALELD
jgi:hypothetical protein